jgi:hypothetical protein
MLAKTRGLAARGMLVITLSLFSPFLQAQQSSSLGPQAPPFLWRTIAVMTGGTRVKSATLAGTITLYGQTNNATSTFSASADSSGNSQFNISDGLSEYRTVSGGTSSGTVIGPGDVSYTLSAQSPMTTSAWFLAAFSVAARLVPRDYANSYMDSETQNGVLVHHLQVWQQANGATPEVSASVKSLTLEDIYLDQMSHLPVLVAFNLHLGTGSLSNVPVQVYFSNYQQIQNCTVAYHIQVYMNSSLFWDLQVSSATFSH